MPWTDRLFQRVRAVNLALSEIQPLHPDMRLDAAAQQLVSQVRKSLPVVDDDNRVVGILTETAPAITTREHAGFRDIGHAFHRHEGRGMPVVDEEGRLKGLLLRKDFIKARHLKDLL